MRFLASFLTTFVSFAFLGSVIARAHNSDASHRKRHGTGESLSTPILAWNGSTALEKRYDGVRFSFYDAGLGACGKRNGGSDFIVAMNHFQFDSGDYCFKTITINCEGKSAQAQIVDRCVECPFGALDFSRGLFDHFANEDRGYIYGSWTLGSGEEPKPSPKPHPTTTKEKPSPSPSPTPKPKPTTTSTSSKKISTSVKTVSSSTLSSKTSTATSSSTSSLATPSPTIVATDAISQMNLALVNVGSILIGGVLIGAAAQ